MSKSIGRCYSGEKYATDEYFERLIHEYYDTSQQPRNHLANTNLEQILDMWKERLINMKEEKLQNIENVTKNVANENSQDLTERWLKKQIPEDTYYIECADGTFDYLIYMNDDDPEIDRHLMNIKKVLEPVPSYEKWRALNENLDSVMQTNQAMGKKLLQIKELLKKCGKYLYEQDLNYDLIAEIDEVLK